MQIPAEDNKRSIYLACIIALFLMGCSKHGAKSHLMDGGTMTTPNQQDRTPTDTNLPDLNQSAD